MLNRFRAKKETGKKQSWTRVLAIFYIFLSIFMVGCRETTRIQPGSPEANQSQNADDFLIVDCLLPGQIRRMGTKLTFLTARQAVRTSAVDCRIRGGEYVAYDRANYATALKTWLPLADGGDPEAQTNVGEIFERGLGLEPDYKLAASWYSKAAKQGLSRAQINLGHLYEKGLGVKEDKARALDLYRLASGIKDDKLLYASTLHATHVPKASFDAIKAELAANKRKNRQLQKQLNSKNAQLKSTQRQHKKVENQLRNSLAKAKRISQSIPSTAVESVDRQSQLNDVLSAQLSSLQLEKQQLNQQLANLKAKSRLTEQDLRDTRRQVELSRQEAERFKRQLADASKASQRINEQVSQSNRQLEKIKNDLKRQKTQSSSQQNDAAIKALEAELAQQQQQHNLKVLELEELRLLNTQLQGQLEEADQRSKQQLALSQQQQDESINENVKLRFLLMDKENRLKAVEEQLLVNNAVLTVAENKYLEQIETLTKEHKQQLAQSDREIQQLTREIAQSRRKRLEQEQTITKIQWEMESIKEQGRVFAAAERGDANTDVALVPSIEIIDPPVVLTRSQPVVKLRSKSEQREVIGKVKAPSGVLLFSVNGEKQVLVKNSLFRVKVPLGAERTPVDIVAVDKAGRRVSVNFTIENALADAQPRKKVSSAVNSKFGRYHALVIGNNSYANYSTLQTAVTDAKETERVLRTKYGYKTKLLINATRYQMLSALNELRETLQENDNLLIYYAGHGKLDDSNNRSYWLPTDAEQSNSANWISSSAITDMLNAMAAKHIIVVADSCYAGSMTQSSVARTDEALSDEERDEWVDIMAETRARVMLTSGGVQPVLDGGGGKHSVFANAFIRALKENNGLLEGFNLYSKVLSNLQGKTTDLGEQQIPQYSPIHMAGHEAGEFFFSASL